MSDTEKNNEFKIHMPHWEQYADVREGRNYYYIDGVDLNELRLPQCVDTLMVIRDRIIPKLIERGNNQTALQEDEAIGHTQQLDREVANQYAEFVRDLAAVINKHSKENGSDTPDYILAEHLARALENFDLSSRRRDDFMG